MKRVLHFALALFSAAACARAQSPPAPAAAAQAPAAPVVKVEPAKVVPVEIFEAELADLEGVDFSLSDYRGRVFVLNFWASWCGPCRVEIPELNKLYEEYSPRGVEFVGLTLESPGAGSAKVREFAREFKMTYKLGHADPDVARALMSGTSIPQTLVVAADGRVVLRVRGYSNTVPKMLRAGLDAALEPPPAAEPPAAHAPPAARVSGRP